MSRSDFALQARQMAANVECLWDLGILIADEHNILTGSPAERISSTIEAYAGDSSVVRALTQFLQIGSLELLPIQNPTVSRISSSKVSPGIPETQDLIEAPIPSSALIVAGEGQDVASSTTFNADLFEWSQPVDDVGTLQQATTYFGRSLSAFIENRLRFLYGDEEWLSSGCHMKVGLWKEKDKRSTIKPRNLLGYAELGELKDIIINRANWPVFRPYFKQKDLLITRFTEIVDMRHAGMHPEQRELSFLDNIGPIWSMARVARAYHPDTADVLDELAQEAAPSRLEEEPSEVAQTLGSRVLSNLGDFRSPEIIGRERELADLRDFWTDPFERICSITGAGGVGKTALAAQFIANLVAMPWNVDTSPVPEAIIFLTAKEDYFKGLLKPDPESRKFANLHRIYQVTIATISGLPTVMGTAEEQRTLTLELASQSPILFVLDNLETLDETEAPAVYRFITNLPSPSKCVLTTRVGRDIGRPLVLSGLPYESARDLFLSKVADFGIEITDEAISNVADSIVKYASGFPLSLIRAATMISEGHEPSDILSRLRGQESLAFLEFSFESSIRSLSAADVQILYYLALSPTDRSRKECGFFSSTDDELTTTLSRLLSATLIVRTSEDKKSIKFRVAHDPIRDYIKKRAPEILTPHACSEVLKRTGVQTPEAVAVQVRAEIAKCLTEARDTAHEIGWEAACSMLEASVAKWGRDPEMLASLGYYHYRSRRRELAIPLLREAILLGRETGDVYFHLALCLYYDHDYDGALASAEAALTIDPGKRLAEQLAGECLYYRTSSARFELSTDQSRKALSKAISHFERSFISNERSDADVQHNERSQAWIDRIKDALLPER